MDGVQVNPSEKNIKFGKMQGKATKWPSIQNGIHRTWYHMVHYTCEKDSRLIYVK